MSKSKEYFKSIMDWKFLNYLIDNLTEFEDDGYKFCIYVGLSGKTILFYNGIEIRYQTISDNEFEIIMNNNNFKFTYRIAQMDWKLGILNKYYNKIYAKSDKFRIDLDTDNYSLNIYTR